MIPDLCSVQVSVREVFSSHFLYFPFYLSLSFALLSLYEAQSVDIGIVCVAAGSSKVRLADCSTPLSQATAGAHMLLNNKHVMLSHVKVSCFQACHLHMTARLLHYIAVGTNNVADMLFLKWSGALLKHAVVWYIFFTICLCAVFFSIVIVDWWCWLYHVEFVNESWETMSCLLWSRVEDVSYCWMSKEML